MSRISAARCFDSASPPHHACLGAVDSAPAGHWPWARTARCAALLLLAGCAAPESNRDAPAAERAFRTSTRSTPRRSAVPRPALVSRIRMRIRRDLQVRRVELRRAEPPAGAPYAELFRAPVRFRSGADRLCFASAVWNAPTESADASLARLLEEHARILAQRVPHAASGFRAEVEKAIAGAVPDGGSAAVVARVLHVSVRTLQRRLDASGTTFRAVADSVRGQLAEAYLADPTVSIAEVAFLLGFSDQSSFNRAFRRWTGESPGRWRRRRA